MRIRYKLPTCLSVVHSATITLESGAYPGWDDEAADIDLRRFFLVLPSRDAILERVLLATLA